MNKITALLVDDEFLALKLLEDYIKKIPDIEIIDKVRSPVKAVEILNRHRVELLFLDIQMPTLSGTNLLKTLKYKPVTIFTTAYSEHAVLAFELDAVDYLLKPFSFERFLQAVNKAKEQLYFQRKQFENQGTGWTEKDKKERLVFKADGKVVKVGFDEILFIEGLKEYVKIVCENNYFVTLESLKNLENTLPSEKFLRVHKSFIVSIPKVKALNGNMLEIGKYEIPVSREKKEYVLKIIFG